MARGRILLWVMIPYEGNPPVTVDVCEEPNSRISVGTLEEEGVLCQGHQASAHVLEDLLVKLIYFLEHRL